jgi:hypothetical protein
MMFYMSSFFFAIDIAVFTIGLDYVRAICINVTFTLNF